MKGQRDVRARLMKSLLDISNFINFVENPELILSLIVEESVILTRARWGAILTYDAKMNLDGSQITRLLSGSKKAKFRALFDMKIKEAMDKFEKEDVIKARIKTRPALISSIKKREALLGAVIVIDKKDGKDFSNEDMRNLSYLCREAAVVIENIDLIKAKLKTERLAAVGETMAGISHCIRNILAGISMASYLLDGGLKDDNLAVVKKAWAVVNKNTKRISDLVMDMLNYSKERKPTKEKMNPKVLIGDVLELVKSKLHEKNIRLITSLKGIPQFIKADEKGIHRSVLNIIGNAIDACDKPESVIEVKTVFDKPAKMLKIVISDNGKGIPEEDRQKLFSPFYSSKGQAGTGLGLAVTKKIIEEHGGSIKVTSEPNKGTSFEISIPVAGRGSFSS